MPKVACNYPGCSDRRVHYQQPDTRRKHQMVEVPEDHRGPAYCSIECMLYHEAVLEKEKNDQEE